ncbi:MAG: radical SAM protein [Endomicrobium sp.]|jgi:sulfatase maturation enzyme AslB (radical SAM superfamily)|nr:radical SAM protein [Endomicrobium sp.]
MDQNVAYFAINYKCNHRCLFCPNRSEKYKGMMNLNEFKKSLDTVLSKSNVKHITISGGEPTLNKDFIEILKYATQCNITVGLFSNSDRFFEKGFVEKLANNIDVNNLTIISPIYGHKSDIHDKITLSIGSFRRTVQGLKNLIDKNFKISVKNCLNHLNYKYIDEYINFVIKEFHYIKSIGLYGLDYCGTTKEQNKNIMVKFSEISPYLETALNNFENKNSKLHLHISDIPLCTVRSKYWKYFLSNKNKINAARSAPDTKNFEYGKVEFNTPIQCGTFSSKCKTCDVENECPGTWKSSWELLSDSDVMPIKLLK